MTPTKTAYGHPATPGNAVAFDGINSILRTRWIEPARRTQQRRNCDLIHANRSHRNRSHLAALDRDQLTWPESTRRRSPDLTQNIDPPGDSWSSGGPSTNPARRARPSRSDWTRSAVAPRTPVRATRTTSHPRRNLGHKDQIASRKSRRARFRRMAFPRRLLATSP